MPLATVGTVTALAKLTEQAVMYTHMTQTGIERVLPIATVGTVTALALLTEDMAMYIHMTQTGK